MGGDGRLRLPRNARITASDEIRTLFRRGKRRKTRHLDVFVSASPVSYSRVGIVVPKHRHRIVDRNRLKRRLREIVRVHSLPHLNTSGLALDLLIRARPEGYDAGFAELADELARVMEELCSEKG